MNIESPHGNLKLSNSLIPVLLCLLMLINVCGYSVWFNIAENRIRREIRAQIRQGLEEKDLSVIEILNGEESSIKWLEAGREFVYHGEMYDVVRMESFSNKQVYHCIQDIKEKRLIASFTRNHESSQKAKKILSNFQINFIYHSPFQQTILDLSNHEFGYAPFNIHPKIADIFDPPPKAA